MIHLDQEDQCTAAQTQKAITAYLKSKQLLPFGIAEQHGPSAIVTKCRFIAGPNSDISAQLLTRIPVLWVAYHSLQSSCSWWPPVLVTLVRCVWTLSTSPPVTFSGNIVDRGASTPLRLVYYYWMLKGGHRGHIHLLGYYTNEGECRCEAYSGGMPVSHIPEQLAWPYAVMSQPLTLKARGSTLDVRIWRLLMSDSNV